MLNHILLSVGLYCSSRVGVGQGVKTGDHDDYMQLKKKKKNFQVAKRCFEFEVKVF